MNLARSTFYSGQQPKDARIVEKIAEICVGCIHHSDRGSQYAAEPYRELLAAHGLRGSMGWRGNPYDNAKAESFMKTLKVEAVYLGDYETLTDVVTDLPHFH